ncbi:hypothetical protein D3C72_1448680 [compost metagenome]
MAGSNSPLSATVRKVARVERSRSSASRPPRINWNTWARNSISRMPPRPSLTLLLRSGCSRSWRLTSARIWPCMVRMASMTPKSR